MLTRVKQDLKPSCSLFFFQREVLFESLVKLWNGVFPLGDEINGVPVQYQPNTRISGRGGFDLFP